MIGGPSCERCREAISARIDGEQPGLPDEVIDRHTAGCAKCRAFAEGVAEQRRRLRLRVAEDVPDLTDRILAAIGAEPGRGQRRGPDWQRRAVFRRRPVWLSAAAVIAAALVAASVLAGRALSSGSGSGSGLAVTNQVAGSSGQDKQFPGATVLTASVAKPDLTLTDTAGKPFNLVTATAGKVTLLYFGYTHCPDVCPINMALAARAIQELPPSERGEVTTVFVTTDPGRDTPAAIRAWLDQFDDAFVGLTGSVAAIHQAEMDVQMPLSYGLPAGTATGTTGYPVVHSGYTLVYGRNGRASLQVTDSESVPGFATTLRHLLAGAPV